MFIVMNNCVNNKLNRRDDDEKYVSDANARVDRLDISGVGTTVYNGRAYTNWQLRDGEIMYVKKQRSTRRNWYYNTRLLKIIHLMLGTWPDHLILLHVVTYFGDMLEIQYPGYVPAYQCTTTIIDHRLSKRLVGSITTDMLESPCGMNLVIDVVII